MANAISRAKRENIALTLYPTSGATFRALLLNDGHSDYTTASTNINISTNIITIAGNDYEVGTRVLVSTSGSLSTDLTAGAVYFVVYKSTDDIKISATPGGSEVNFTSQGTGTYTFTELTLIQTVSSVVYTPFTMADLVRRELDNYQGQSTRPTLSSISAPVEATIEGVWEVSATIAIANTSGASVLSYDSLAIIRGGSATVGNTTGTIEDIITLGSTQTIAINGSSSHTHKFRVA